MTSFKGTPGKWFQSHRPIPFDEDGMYATQVYTEDGETIATLSWCPKQKEKGTHEGKSVLITRSYREENALLISKAPEMLEMLERMLNQFEYDNASEFECELFWDCKQLIKSATEL